MSLPKPPYSPRAAANFFIGSGLEARNPVDPMKTQKLVYIAHGRCLCDFGTELVNERVKAWIWGPVIPSLYHDLKPFGNCHILHPIFASPEQQFRVPTVNPRDNRTIDLLTRVWNKFSGHSAKSLSALTHVTSSPWFVARAKAGVAVDEKSDIEIDSQEIAAYFRDNFKC